ncbi:HesA/MoeB/ThiF family protein [Acuticoccus sp. MNP-M23]|uniref:HesA/MoeB/ThiF family protein n=1 Tax=Acuticoccus sp. MNP-M23 TaxID=3072793 RepID=UPI0028162E3F|nr:HesA/MoeB/ThiF family protein [Acuticoccus sp. MNP-M23]WMS44813.1 HesA/MoeB/ThiF family protein [Acuticoccus sp. MNP-M23]
MTLSPDEIERYARHLVLSGVGGPGQQALRRARVAVVGAGGLGSPLVLYLAAAGVGTIRIIDDDTVALSNLQRQVLFATADTGNGKAEAAAAAVHRLNPHITVETSPVRLTADNAAGLLEGVSVAADGSDNAATRYAVSDACFHARVPLVSGAVHGFDGHVTTLAPFGHAADGTPNPTYRCLFPDPPPDAMVDECARHGILGAVTGVIGTLQANEVLKLILGTGEPLIGRLLLFDARDTRFDTITYAWSPANPLTGTAAQDMAE